jgi:excisionase family DNA binding protein
MIPPRSKSRPRASSRNGSSAGRRGEFLTPTEVADRLLVAPVTVRLWASKGLLPSVTTPGGHRRFRSEDVESFVSRYQQGRGTLEAPPSRILIIDDDAQFARYLSSMLQSRAPGISVDVAHDGFSAGVKCESMRPDVVTLDLQMPDMDGYEVCAFLRGMFKKQSLRILALTAFASLENTQRIIAAGADACIAKSVPAEELLRELRVARAE